VRGAAPTGPGDGTGLRRGCGPNAGSTTGMGAKARPIRARRSPVANEAVCKPFGYPELRGRVRALLRRTGARAPRGVTRVGPLQIDHVARAVQVGGTPVELSAREYALLTHLATDPRRVFTKHELLRDVWGFRSPGQTRTLDSYACRLRRKLTSTGDARFVENVWGVGYRLARLDLDTERESAA